METWSIERLHRFKNMLAFLYELEAWANLTEEQTIESLEPTLIEGIYLKFLGPDLPTPHEYSVNISEKASKNFELYLSTWSGKHE